MNNKIIILLSLITLISCSDINSETNSENMDEEFIKNLENEIKTENFHEIHKLMSDGVDNLKNKK